MAISVRPCVLVSRPSARTPVLTQKHISGDPHDPCAELAESMVRCLPEDGTNGFFVACFVKDTTAAPIEAPNMPERAKREDVAAPAAGEEEADGAASAFEDEVLGDAAAEQDVVLPSTSSSTATKKGGNQKKAKSTITQSTRNAKEDVLGKAKADVDEAAANGKGGKKLTKKQLYLLKKEELKRKKAEAAGGAPAPAEDEAEE